MLINIQLCIVINSKKYIIKIIYRKLEKFGVDYESALSPGIADVWEEGLWFKSDASRQDAVCYLQDMPDGTFLVRLVYTAYSILLLFNGYGPCII